MPKWHVLVYFSENLRSKLLTKITDGKAVRRGGCNEVAQPTTNYSQGCCNSHNHPVRLRRPPLRWRGI